MAFLISAFTSVSSPSAVRPFSRCAHRVRPRWSCAASRSSSASPEWTYREKLDPEVYRVTREGGTERPFTGELLHEKRAGVYLCRCCGAELFSSRDKYDSGTGWPSEDNVAEKLDLSNHMFRIEVLCPQCDAHLGHNFPDVTPTGLRYCINSVAMAFQPQDSVEEDTTDERGANATVQTSAPSSS